MARVLLIRPIYDRETSMTHGWAQSVVQMAAKWQHDLVQLTTDAHRGNVQRALSSRNNPPDYVIMYGHGEDEHFSGQDGGAVLDLANVGLLEGTIVCAVACWTATMLGREAVRSGSRAYFGYTAQLWLAVNAPEAPFNRITRRATAAISKVLLNPQRFSCRYALASALEIYGLTHRDYLAKARGKPPHPNAVQIAARLARNQVNLRLLGNDEETL